MDLSLKSKNRGRNFPCPLCPLRCASKSALQSHINAVHNFRIQQCTFSCGYFSKNDSAMKRHLLKFHKDNPLLKCDLCTFTSIDPYGITTHKRNVHIEKKFQCAYCPKKFGLVGHRKWHMKRDHITVKMFKCPYCDYFCRRKDEQHKHEESKHRFFFYFVVN